MISRKIVFLIITVFWGANFLQSKFHPEINWMEISRGKFTIIFPRDYRECADYTLRTAEELYPIIEDFWKSDVKSRIRVLLHDSSDISAENATYFPYNQIRISLYPPEPDTLFGNSTDHIRDVLRHGLDRIFVFNQGSKTLSFFRKYFGINPIFFPSIFIPAWALTGISAFEEINSNTDTRFDSPEFDLILKKIAENGKFPPLSALKSKLSKWPGPFSNYIFGVGLVKFLSSDVHGNKIREFVKNYTSYPFPMRFNGLFNPRFMSMSERFMMVFGKDIENIWKDLELIKGESSIRTPKTLTDTGFLKKYPLLLPEGDIVFFSEDFKNYPGVFILKASGGKPSLIFRKKSVKSLSYFKKGKILYFSAVDTYKRYYKFSDIYSYNLRKKELKRLTNGKRLTSPIRSGDRIYCIKREKSRSYLAYTETGSSRIKIITGGFKFLTGLSVSPSSKHIAVSVKTGRENWKIGIFNMSGDLEGFVENGGERAFSPIWKSDNELLFVTSVDNGFSISSYHLVKQELKIYDADISPGVKYFDLMRGNAIITTILTENGYELLKFDLGKVKSLVTRSSLTKLKVEDRIYEADVKDRKYRAFRDFTPKYFTLTFREGGNEVQAGLVASGFDSLDRHYFKIKYLKGLSSWRSNYYLNYIFNGFSGELNLKYTNFSDLNKNNVKGDFSRLAEKFTISVNFPLVNSLKGSFSFYTDIHFEKTEDDFIGKYDNDKTIYNGIRIGFSFNSTEAYYNSISETDGMNLKTAYSMEMRSLGSPSDSSVFTLEYSQFIRIFHLNTLALRFTFAESKGEVKREFYMGGISGGDEQSFLGEKIFGLLRGYPSGYFRGTGGFSLNFEYRMLLLKIERSFLIFSSVESLYSSFFFDAGQMWGDNKRFDPVYSAGGEINIILYLGKHKFIMSGGIGSGLHPMRTLSAYFRLGSSF